jgi:hypothetical protein
MVIFVRVGARTGVVESLGAASKDDENLRLRICEYLCRECGSRPTTTADAITKSMIGGQIGEKGDPHAVLRPVSSAALTIARMPPVDSSRSKVEAGSPGTGHSGFGTATTLMEVADP